MQHRFELYHLSLLPRVQSNLFNYDYDKFTREQWLRKVFCEESSFIHSGETFHYVPAQKQNDSDLITIIGKIGRKLFREENKSPAEGFDEITHETWKAALLVLDPTHHNDGQKLAIQNLKEVGQSKQLILKLVSNINERYKYGPYSIQVAQIIEEQSFWDFVEENKGKVTSLALEFIAPNMFGSEDEFSKEIKAFKDSEFAEKVKLTIENDSGLNPDTRRMRLAVNYASKGGGKIRAKAKNKKIYNSSDKVKYSRLEDVKETGAELIELARKLKDRILGRE